MIDGFALYILLFLYICGSTDLPEAKDSSSENDAMRWSCAAPKKKSARGWRLMYLVGFVSASRARRAITKQRDVRRWQLEMPALDMDLARAYSVAERPSSGVAVLVSEHMF